MARYEASAHTFLFPDDPGSQQGDVRHVQLTRRSKAVQNKVTHRYVCTFSSSYNACNRTEV